MLVLIVSLFYSTQDTFLLQYTDISNSRDLKNFLWTCCYSYRAYRTVRQEEEKASSMMFGNSF